MKKVYKHIPLIILGAVMSILALINLGNRFMYLDEANTALLGESVLRYGYPRAWDGDYLITAANGNDFNQNFVFLYYPWVQYYISAFSQLFGNTNFHLRFWFVLLGIVSIVPFYYLSLIFVKNQKTAFLATLLYSLSVPVLLFIRTVRYYSPSLLFIILIYFFYEKLIKELTYKYCALFVIACILLFYTFSAFFFITMVVIIYCYIIFDRNKENIKKFLISLVIITGFTLFYFIYYYSFITTVGSSREGFQGIYYFLLQIPGYFWMLHVNFFPIITLMIIYLLVKLIARVFIKKDTSNFDNIIAERDTLVSDTTKMTKRTKWLLIAPIVVNIVFVSMFSIYYGERFLIACIPLTFILSAHIIRKIMNHDKIVGTIVILIFMFTNMLNIFPYLGIKILNIETNVVEPLIKPPMPYLSVERDNHYSIYNLNDYLDKYCYVRSYIWDYYKSANADFNDEIEGVVKLLDIYSQKGDSVVTYAWLADGIHYYTGLNITNRLHFPEERDYYYFKNYNNAYKYIHLTESDNKMADWIVITGWEDWNDEFQKSEIWKNEEIFEKITIYDYPVSTSTGTLSHFNFFTNENNLPIYIYRNKLTTMPIEKTVFIKEDLEKANIK